VIRTRLAPRCDSSRVDDVRGELARHGELLADAVDPLPQLFVTLIGDAHAED
jgi:hypothetical protein